MRKTLLASVSVLAIGCSSAPVQAASPAPSWTGYYVGLNAGYAWGNANPTLIVSPFPATAVPSLTPRGFIGGGQAGYNWQTGQWVFGGEIDFSGLDAKADATISPFFRFKGSNSATWSSRYDWLFTARLRGGLTVAPNWLLYVTGGLAVTQVRDSATLTTFAATWSESNTLAGGTIGGGIETILGSNWTARVEYLFAKFKDTTPPQTSGLPVISPPFSFNHDLNVIRFAINYKFGS